MDTNFRRYIGDDSENGGKNSKDYCYGYSKCSIEHDYLGPRKVRKAQSKMNQRVSSLYTDYTTSARSLNVEIDF